jgi:hypothetical protein
MSGDIQRLFSIINQTDLPYQVFEDQKSQPQASGARAALAAPQEAPIIEQRPPADEDVTSTHAGLFRAYNVEAALSAPPRRLLADVFSRMAGAKVA